MGELRAYLDGELAAGPHAKVEAHLGTCAHCRTRLGQLEATRTATACHLAAVQPPVAPDTARAWSVLRHVTRESNVIHDWRDWIMKHRTWRSLATGVVALALIVGVLSLAPARALAREFLSLFRVQKFTVVRVNPNEAQVASLEEAVKKALLTQEPEVLVDEPESIVATIEEARAIAGFEARMPGFLPGTAPEIHVKGRTELRAVLAPDALKTLFQLAEMNVDEAATNVGNGEVYAILPAAVMIETDSVSVMQVLEPTLEYPEGVDPALVAEAGLRLMGVAPEDAHRLSRQVDWTNTLLLPVPTQVAVVNETVIAGERAVMLVPQEDRGKLTLLWQKDGVVYVVSGRVGQERLISVAESLF
jgi:anti-sigma factor RsiW